MHPSDQAAIPDAPGSTGVHLEPGAPGELKAVLRGQLKFDTVENLLIEIRAECDRVAPAKLIVDCAEVDFIDSQALSLLLSLSRGCKQRGGTMEVHRPRPMVRNLLQITRLDTLMTVVDQGA